MIQLFSCILQSLVSLPIVDLRVLNIRTCIQSSFFWESTKENKTAMIIKYTCFPLLLQAK